MARDVQIGLGCLRFIMPVLTPYPPRTEGPHVWYCRLQRSKEHLYKEITMHLDQLAHINGDKIHTKWSLLVTICIMLNAKNGINWIPQLSKNESISRHGERWAKREINIYLLWAADIHTGIICCESLIIWMDSTILRSKL